MNSSLPPQVYRLHQDKDKQHYVTPSLPCFDEPAKVYGKSLERVERYWNDFSSKLGSSSILLTGTLGSGKSMIAELLCNKAIKNNYPVIQATEINATIVTVQYITALTNVVILFDEFGKNFNNKLQEKMLSMMSGVGSGKKLFILTENYKSRLSEFLFNRPGRVRYSHDFSRLEVEVLEEYCEDMKVSKQFYNNLLIKYNEITSFTFDQLQGLVTEHKKYPNDSFDELLEWLNLDGLIKPKILNVFKVTEMVDGDEITHDFRSQTDLTYKRFQSLGRLWVDIFEPTKKDKEEEEPSNFRRAKDNLNLTKEDVVTINETYLFHT